MSVHASLDGGKTSICGDGYVGFEYTKPGDLQTGDFAGEPCGKCLGRLRDVTKAFRSADPDGLQSVGVRIFDASGRESMSLAVNIRDYEIEVSSVNRYDQEKQRDIIEFKMVATARRP
jgi:hypothetical protein